VSPLWGSRFCIYRWRLTFQEVFMYLFLTAYKMFRCSKAGLIELQEEYPTGVPIPLSPGDQDRCVELYGPMSPMDEYDVLVDALK
jgi:hypothetical protein